MSREDRLPGSRQLPGALRPNGSHPRSDSSARNSSDTTPRLPAALGVTTSSDASLRQMINDRSLSSSQSWSSSSSKSSDGLRFSSDAGVLPRTFSAQQFDFIPTWSPQGSSSRRTPIPGLSSASQQLDAPPQASPSRNFLVPIGATGARQKLSIANAAQRRRLAASEDIRWADDPADATPTAPIPMARSQSQNEITDRISYTPMAMNRSASHNGLTATDPATQERMLDGASTPPTSELVQQAAMLRLSSQRIPYLRPDSDHRSRDASSSSQGSYTTSQSASTPSTPPKIASRDQLSNQDAKDESSIDRFKTSDGSTTLTRSPGRASPARPERAAARTTPRKVVSATVDSASLAETYKQSMVNRDPRTVRPDAAILTHNPESAPKLEVQVPSSSFFDDLVDSNASLQTDKVPVGESSARSSNDDEEAKRASTLSTSESDTSIGSFEGAYDYGVIAPHVPMLNSFDEALKAIGNDSEHTGPAYDHLLTEKVFQTLSRTDAAPQLQDSYLAMSDEDDVATVAHDGPSTPTRVARPPTSRSNTTSPSARPIAGVWDADKVFADQDPPSSNMIVDNVMFQTVSPPSILQSTAKPIDASPAKPPQAPSFTTFQVSSFQAEPRPGIREEASLEAGAMAALPGMSPRSTIFPTSSSTAEAYQPRLQPPAFNANFAAREEPRLDPVASPRYRATFDAQDNLTPWLTEPVGPTPISPVQRSRFSEASTVRSHSVAQAKADDLHSTIGSAPSSDDGLDADSGHALPTSAWTEVEIALKKYREMSLVTPTERGNVLRGVLLPFLALEAETVSVETVGGGQYTNGKTRRALFFEWTRFLLLELQHVQTSADRGAILESIACIIESRNFSVSTLSADPEDEDRFSFVFGHILAYAIGELNKKGVYQNTLIFSGRLLAVAFFRVKGVASKLLRALPVSRFALERVATEYGWKDKAPADFSKFVRQFPETLRPLCYKDSRSYLRMLDDESGQFISYEALEDDRFLVRQPEVEVEMSGNWLRRWQSDDSELFFSFCRSYHRQLANLLTSTRHLKSASKHFFGGPGYAHLATCVHQKCLALVHRVIMSVTTLSSQKNFNPAGETANVFSGSTAGKPRILEAANRRCTAIVVDIVRAPAGNSMIFAPMLDLHIKALIKRTSLYDVQGVFCLLDWLDGVLSHMESADLMIQSLVDVGFIISTVGRLLDGADHALALMRTIAFCYANFGVLTATTSNRIAFCEQILLKPVVFNKLFLSWSFTIRAYFLHLLVFRLARIRDFPRPQDDPGGLTTLRIVRIFNQRLEDLRKRHNQLSPDTDSSSDGGQSEDAVSRKSGTSTFVSTIKRTSSESPGPDPLQEVKAKAEKLALTGTPPSKAAITSNAVSPDSGKGTSKTKSWLKSFRSGGRSRPGSAKGDERKAGSFTANESYADSKGVSSNQTTPRTSFESAASDALSDASTLAGSIRTPKGEKNGAYEFKIKQQQQQQSSPAKQQVSARPLQQQQSSATKIEPTVPFDGTQRSTKTRPPALVIAPEAVTERDTVFDLQSTHNPLPNPGYVPGSPRISRAFSRRASILPSAASDLVTGTNESIPAIPGVPLLTYSVNDGANAYDDSLHVYAVSGLREYEQTVQEHDDFFVALPKDQAAQVPKLPVTWPAMWSSTGD